MESEVNTVQGAAADGAQQIKETLKEPLTILWEHVPAWKRDNHYILSGYRKDSGSYRVSAASLGYIHNETINIYSHLIGSFLFAIGSLVLWSTLFPGYETTSDEDVYVFGCFFLGAIICLGMSATYHTISNHSPKVGQFGNKLDYLGIVFLIWGSFIPSIYYGFTCEPQLIRTYWTMITTIGAGCGFVSMSPAFATPEWRPFRAAMFVAMGLSAVIPVLHGLKLYGPVQMNSLIGLRWLILQGTLYVSGAAIYAARIPERFKPGRFDIVGSSHQIFHILVLLAAASHLVGLIKVFDYHHSHSITWVCSRAAMATHT